MKKLAIALTGHRPPKLAGYDYNNIFYKRLYKKLDNIVKKLLLGMIILNYILVWH